VPGKLVTLKLNQQQLELLDRTIARGAAPDREALIRRALREYAAKHTQPKAPAAPGGPGARA
jgi:Arc/MetJ-type ribon-helix-helix transcriptional regulator